MIEIPKQRWGCLQWGAIGFGLLLVGLFDVRGTHPRAQMMGMQLKAMNNCTQIILVLKMYSKDKGGIYPDRLGGSLRSSNEVFRKLFGIETDDERIFGCPDSPFQPDGVTGSPPAFEKALGAGECHWMLLKHQGDASHPKIPIIIENSLKPSWPPKWDIARPAIPQWLGDTSRKRGRSWRGSENIIGRNDGSVAVEKLRPDGTLDWHSPNNLGPDGKSWLDSLTPEQIAKLEYWDIEEK
jgi:hypothetical protein|uniref:hypothetical protein n=1 Tax=Prosthecobacter sp. TaxID=1965333 RepID=UPI0037845D25